jgi:hypothetical protein
MKVKNGDLLKILMEDGEHMYAEKVGNIYENDEYEVYFINSDSNDIYTYNDYIDTVPRKSVLYHVRNTGDYELAWKQMNFNTLSNNNGITRLCKDANDKSDHDSIQVDSIDSDSESTDLGSEDTYSSSEEDNESCNDFIDDDPQTFCHSTCECELCESMKINNQLYISWAPKTLFEKRMKYTIDKLEIDAINELDNAQFSNH